MYADFFGLKQEPFSIAPDPRYLFMSERHREALAHLLYGLGGGGGFVLLTGEIGAGKTTVCRCFLEQIPKRCNVAYIFNPKLTVEEMLKSVCDEFRVPHQHPGAGNETIKDYVDALNHFLLRTHAVGQNNVLIIDEAQNLSADVLEQLRLLTNLETNERKLLQIVLIGQPELRGMLARPETEQIAQRVIARFHLEALSEQETTQYVRHRFAVAGMNGANPFDREAMARIHALSRGVPRRINLLCDRALLGAYASGTVRIGRAIVDRAAKEVFDQPTPRGRTRAERVALVGVGLAAGAALVGASLWVLGGASAPRPIDLAATAALPRSEATQVAAGKRVEASPTAPLALATSAAKPTAAPTHLNAAELKTRIKDLPTDEAAAWRELARAWGLSLGDGPPCEAAQRQQIHCFRSAGSLALLRQLDRPGILALRDDNDQLFYALLTGMTGQGATLRFGDDEQTVTLGALARMWRGEFATFWRVPPGYQEPLIDGRSAPAVAWLSDKLAAFDGATAADGQPLTDAALRSRVQAFQSTQGLKPDGLAGPITLMYLNRATGVDEPRLQGAR